MKYPPNQLMVKRYRAGLGRIIGRMILLLTTIGRKSGKLHTVAVQYEVVGGRYFIGAGGGLKSDWFQNIQANPHVEIEVGKKRYLCTAEPMLDVEKIADFLEYRLKRHPIMIRLILKMDGCSFHPSRQELLEYSRRLAVVVITPDDIQINSPVK